MANRRRAGWRAVKLHRNYTVDEVARTLGRCKGTVRRWLGTGLPALSDRRLVLILSEDLIEFLKARSKPRTRCALDECYCFKCRASRKAAGRMADWIPMTTTSGNLRTLCEQCGTLMHKRVSHRQLEAVRAILDVSIPEH
jgi:excisionase family DNA binding protein